MRVSLILLALFSTSLVFGQHEGDYWYFGDHAGVHFNNGNPETLLNGALSTGEGCAAISTPDTGELLFYTDGSTVYNKEHQIMMNGTGLNGDASSTQSAVIVPNLNDPKIYYIFTVDSGEEPVGLQYSEVNMNLDGGLGGITSVKNVQLQGPVSEKLTAIKNANSTGFWVVAHAKYSNEFYSYKVTSDGVTTNPVVSAVGTANTTNTVNYITGYMKISPNGEKIALVNGQQQQLFDFNDSSGIVSNAILLYDVSDDNSINQISYGVEFSPNSKVLYFTVSNFSVFQYNLQAGNPEDIINSKIELQSFGFGAMQLAPNGKIYLNSSNYLNVINFPNIIGEACDLEINSFDLEGPTSGLGLPNFVQSFFDSTIQYENTCFGETTSFSLLNDVDNIDTVNWNFDDPDSGANNTSTLVNPTHIFSAPGSYQVSVETTINGYTSSYSTTVTIYAQPEATQAPDILVCDEDADGFYDFDLTTQTATILNGQDPAVFHVVYYSSQENFDNNNPIATPENFQNDNPFIAQTIFAKVKNSMNADCEASTSFSIEVIESPIPNADPPILTACGDPSLSTQNDLFAEFDLTDEKQNLLDGQSSEDFTFHYYTDAGFSNEIGSPEHYQNLDSPQTIYATIENSENANCSAETSFELEVLESPEAPPEITLQACGLGDGTAEFDTSNLENEILNGQTGFSISYVNSDGETLSNPLPNPFVSEFQSLTAYIENSQHPECSVETAIHLVVQEMPSLSLPDSVFICNNNPVELTADPGYDSYVWSTGETSRTITVTEAGDYAVTVTNTYGDFNCEISKTVTVLDSGKAHIISIEVEDWTAQKNSISVEVNGKGDYIYSLDGVVYQESNHFENLDYTKDHTVYVKDKNDCGITTKKVYLLYYPKFFTPNQDGKNDTWQIFNSYKEPELEIYIFDRFGKLLEKIDPRSQGWDGTFHGKPMPSNDYWFLVKRKNGKRYTGHFTLKR